jgi:hypothetical protein
LPVTASAARSLMSPSISAPSRHRSPIYLPRWFAHNLPAIHVPLILLAAFLHENNIRRARGAGVG